MEDILLIDGAAMSTEKSRFNCSTDSKQLGNIEYHKIETDGNFSCHSKTENHDALSHKISSSSEAPAASAIGSSDHVSWYLSSDTVPSSAIDHVPDHFHSNLRSEKISLDSDVNSVTLQSGNAISRRHSVSHCSSIKSLTYSGETGGISTKKSSSLNCLDTVANDENLAISQWYESSEKSNETVETCVHEEESRHCKGAVLNEEITLGYCASHIASNPEALDTGAVVAATLPAWDEADWSSCEPENGDSLNPSILFSNSESNINRKVSEHLLQSELNIQTLPIIYKATSPEPCSKLITADDSLCDKAEEQNLLNFENGEASCKTDMKLNDFSERNEVTFTSVHEETSTAVPIKLGFHARSQDDTSEISPKFAGIQGYDESPMDKNCLNSFVKNGGSVDPPNVKNASVDSVTVVSGKDNCLSLCSDGGIHQILDDLVERVVEDEKKNETTNCEVEVTLCTKNEEKHSDNKSVLSRGINKNRARAKFVTKPFLRSMLKRRTRRNVISKTQKCPSFACTKTKLNGLSKNLRTEVGKSSRTISGAISKSVKRSSKGIGTLNGARTTNVVHSKNSSNCGSRNNHAIQKAKKSLVSSHSSDHCHSLKIEQSISNNIKHKKKHKYYRGGKYKLGPCRKKKAFGEQRQINEQQCLKPSDADCSGTKSSAVFGEKSSGTYCDASVKCESVQLNCDEKAIANHGVSLHQTDETKSKENPVVSSPSVKTHVVKNLATSSSVDPSRKRPSICTAASKAKKSATSEDYSARTLNKAFKSVPSRSDQSLVNGSKIANSSKELINVPGRCTCHTSYVNYLKQHLSCSNPWLCQAIDTVDSHLVHCEKSVKRSTLYSPSSKVPKKMFCDGHAWRLRQHQCCPVCGNFCSQGSFFSCCSEESVNKPVQLHLFHRGCLNGSSCPHCGLSSAFIAVKLEMSEASHNGSQKYKNSKMRINGSNDVDIPAARKTSFSCFQTKKNIAILKQVVRGYNKSVRTPKPSSKIFFTYLRAGDTENALKFLVQGMDPNYRYKLSKNNRPLHIAAAGGFLQLVHILILTGASKDTVNDHLKTPLMLAIEKNHVNVVECLMNAGASVSSVDNSGRTPVHLAVRSGVKKIVELICTSRQANINAKDDGGWTPLMYACELKYSEIAKWLLASGANPSLEDKEKNNALHWAVFSGEYMMAKLLIDAGCNVNALNNAQDSPLSIATRRGHIECIKLLVQSGVKLDLETADNCSSLIEHESFEEDDIVKKRKSKLLLRDISRGAEAIPISVVNDVNEDSFMVDFCYITKLCESESININRIVKSMKSCKCQDNCSTSNCNCSVLSLKLWYGRDSCLIPEFNMQSPPVLFECTKMCWCSKSCMNRVIQRGSKCHLELFRTECTGWGVRTVRALPRGTFICEYIGELITDSEADARCDDSYLFSLGLSGEEHSYCIDAKLYGNVSRFLNHSCDPNLVAVKAFTDHQDLDFPHIAFFSNRDIKPFEELCFDYGINFWVVKSKRTLCSCKSKKCRYSHATIDATLKEYYKSMKIESNSDS